MIGRLNHVAIAVPDLEKAAAFYRDTLGLHPMREFGSGDGRGVVFFLGGGYLEITGEAGAAPTDSRGFRRTSTWTP